MARGKGGHLNSSRGKALPAKRSRSSKDENEICSEKANVLLQRAKATSGCSFIKELLKNSTVAKTSPSTMGRGLLDFILFAQRQEITFIDLKLFQINKEMPKCTKAIEMLQETYIRI